MHRDYLLGCLLCIGGHLTDKKSQRVIVHLALHNRKTRICDKHTDMSCFTLTHFLPHNLFLCLTSLNDFIRPQIRVVFGVADSFQHVSPCLLLWEIPIKTIQIEHHGLATCPHTYKFCYHITNPCIMRVWVITYAHMQRHRLSCHLWRCTNSQVHEHIDHITLKSQQTICARLYIHSSFQKAGIRFSQPIPPEIYAHNFLAIFLF